MSVSYLTKEERCTSEEFASDKLIGEKEPAGYALSPPRHASLAGSLFWASAETLRRITPIVSTLLDKAEGVCPENLVPSFDK